MSHLPVKPTMSFSQHKDPSSVNPGEEGFSLIELIVALGIFTIVVTMVATGLLSVIDASSRAQNLTEAVNSLNFVMDDMARRMRTGYDFNCPAGGSGNCEGGKKSIEFTRSHVGSGNDPFIQYRLSGGKIQRKKSVSGNSTGWLDLTDEQITISNLQFFLTGENYSAIDSRQTRVLVSVTGTVGSGDTAETFTVQTTIAQRLLFSPDN